MDAVVALADGTEQWAVVMPGRVRALELTSEQGGLAVIGDEEVNVKAVPCRRDTWHKVPGREERATNY